MRIERYGDGPRFFFGLHGWSGDHRTFEPLVANLPEDASFYSVDLPGCGDSAPPARWTVHAVAEEIAEAIAQLPAPVTLIGNCSGANIGFFVTRLVPERIERMVTIDAFAYWPWYFGVFVNRWFGRYAYFTTFENPIGRWLTNLSLTSKRAEDTSLTEGFTRVNHKVTYRYLEMLRDGGNVEQFRGFTIPVDVTYGEKSFTGVHASADRFGELWPRARVTCLRGAGHLPIREATAALHNVIFAMDRVVDLDQNRETLCPTTTTSFAS